MAYLFKDSIKERIEESTIYVSDRVFDELDEVYRKAKAYDLLKDDLLINEKLFREQAENDVVSYIIHGHYIQLLEQAKLEANDET